MTLGGKVSRVSGGSTDFVRFLSIRHSRSRRGSGRWQWSCMGSNNSAEPIQDVEGFRIVHVATGSPAEDAGLESFFDYVTHVLGEPVDGNEQNFLAHFKRAEGSAVILSQSFTPLHARPISVMRTGLTISMIAV